MKDMKDKFKLPAKPGTTVRTELPADEQVATNGKQPAVTPEAPKKVSVNENTVRGTIDFPEDIHTGILKHLVGRKPKQTLKDFVIAAVKEKLERDK